MTKTQEQILIKLSQTFDINFKNIDELRIGTNLMNVVNKLLYKGENQILLQKINNSQTPNNNRAGNNVININVLLKQIKQDKQLMKQSPIEIRQLTFFNLLQDQQKLLFFMNWIIQKAEIIFLKNEQDNLQEDPINSLSSNRFKNIQISLDNKAKSRIYYHQEQKILEEPHQQHEDAQQNNGFQNLYFASHIKQKTQSPEKNVKQQGQKIVRKGSFKLLKPKVSFNEQNEVPKQLEINLNKKDLSSFSLMNQSDKNINIESDQLKELSMIQQSNYYNPNISGLQIMNSSNIYIQDDEILNKANKNSKNIRNINKNMQNQSNISSMQKSIATTPIPKHENEQNRKTIPKNISKPPLYRNGSSDKNKQNINFDKKASTSFQVYQTIQRTKKDRAFFNQSTCSNLIGKQYDNFIMNQDISSFSGYKDNKKQQTKNHSANKQNKQSTKKQNINSQLKQYLQQKIQVQVDTQNKINDSKIIHAKNKYLKNQIYDLQNQISKQSSQLLSFNSKQNYQSAPIQSNSSKNILFDKNKKQINPQTNQNSQFKGSEKKRNSSTRKVLKINLNPLDQAQKHQIIQWLVRINILTTDQINQLEQLQEYFQNGVKFIQICNYYIGRSKQLPCFSNPKKNAQIHSNYSKIFQYLRSLTFFQSQLLFAYEFFIPQPFQNAIWNLLLSMFKVLYKKHKTKNTQNQLIQNKQSAVKRSISKSFILRNESGSKNLDSERSDKFQTNKKSRKYLSKSRASSTKGNFQTPIQFVRQIPEQLKHKDLVQNVQPQTFDNQNNLNDNLNQQNVFIEGYRQRHYRKTMSSMNLFNNNNNKIQTPQKVLLNYNNNDNSIVFNNNNARSISKQFSIQSSKNALKKSLKKSQSSASKYFRNSNQKTRNSNQKMNKQMPKVTLNMQMKVTKWLKKLNLSTNQDDKIRQINLLKDPIRNGCLINILLSLDKQNKLRYQKNPKSIQNCRHNYYSALNIIKSKYGQQQFKGYQIYNNYYPFIQQIIKGEKSLFYGLVYSLIQIYNKKGIQLQINNNNQKHQQQQRIIAVQKQRLRQIIKQFQQNHISWIRYLQRINPKIADLKIRDQQSLKESISSGYLIYNLCKMIINHGQNLTLVYNNPINTMQKQVNLKKLFTHLYLNNILNKDEYKGIQRQLALKSSQCIQLIISKFIPLTINSQKVSDNKHIMSHRNLINSNSNSNVYVNSNNMIKSINLNKYLNREYQMNQRNVKRLQTTADQVENNNIHEINHNQNEGYQSSIMQQKQPQIQINWMRKLGFNNCSLSLKNGVILCRLMSKLTRNNITINQSLTSNHQLSKPQCLLNIRKGLKLLPGSKWDQVDIYQADNKKTMDVYNFIKEKFKHTYQMTRVLSSK